jgi:hypothetical protein
MFIFMCVVVTGWSKQGKVDHSEGNDEERVVAIPRLQDGSPHLCQLKTASFCTRWQALTCIGRMSGLWGAGKPIAQ